MKGERESRKFETLLVTGGAGFMGSSFIRYLFRRGGFRGRIINVDKLSYAGDPENLSELAPEERQGRYRLEICDICDRERLSWIFREDKIDGVVHFAAESHVDRSIAAAEAFAQTNVIGTLAILEAARDAWRGRRDVLFHHVSTDEVYGSCAEGREFRESDRYDPSSPYAASKAGADHMVRAFGRTYDLPFTMTHSCNNYGPRQTPEKLIPLAITRLEAEQPIPVYGTGGNVREWLFVDDHARAVWEVLRRGTAGQSYNVGSGERIANIETIRLLGSEVARQTGRDPSFWERLIVYVSDRPGHDLMYAIDSAALRTELGWSPEHSLSRGIAETVAWYLGNAAWIERAKGRLESWLQAEGDAWARERRA